jgi:hypothetical protein
MRWQADEMASWWNGRLMKRQVDEMASWKWWNGMLIKWQVDEMASWLNVKQMKCQIDALSWHMEIVP